MLLLILIIKCELKFSYAAMEALGPSWHIQAHPFHLGRLDLHIVQPVRRRVQHQQLLKVQQPSLHANND